VLFSAAFTADSRYLLAGGYDSRVSVWRTTPFRDRPPLFTRQLADTVTATATGHGRVAAGSGSGELLVAGVEGGRLGPWQVLPTDGSSQAVTALAWSPDGTTLAVGRGDGQVLRCTPATASCRRLPPAGGDDRVRALVFTRDNALGAAKADALWIWSGSSARARREASGSRSVLGLAATPDGVLAVTAGGRLLRWSVTGSAWGSRTVLASTSALLTALAANQDGSVVIVGDGNGNLTTWRLDHGRTTRVASRSVGRQAVVSMAFVDAGHVVVGAGEGGAVLLRADASRLYVVTTLPGHLGVVPSVAAGPTPSTVLTGGADRTLVWSDLSEPRAVDADPTGFACRIAGRTLSSEERAAYLNGERARGC
jgi:WD40 repeat protein